jgi:hypothetical protein
VNTEKAEFEELLWRDGAGRVHFHGQAPTPARRFRDRVWPVFWRIRPPRQTTEAWERRHLSLPGILYERSMTKAHRIEAARRWWVEPPLQRQWDRVDEAIEATRRTRA